MLLIYLIAAVFYLENVFRIAFSGRYLSQGMFYSLLFTIPIGVLCYLICTAFKEKKRNTVACILLSIITFLFVSQFVYYKIFRMFYTLYSASNAGQVLEFFEIILITVKNNVGPIILMLVPLIGLMIVKKWIKPFKVVRAKERIVLGTILIGTHFIAIGSLHLGTRDAYSPYDLYYQHYYPIISAEKLGLITTLRLDAKRTFFDWNPGLIDSEQEVVLLSQAPDDDMSFPDSSVPTMSESVEESKEYNELDIDFERLIAETDSEEMKAMHTYFNNVKPTAKNDYTGKYKGYNLITITAEGFSPYAIREDLTPTLYKLYNEGYQFTNFYTPLWELSTSDGEYAITTGQIPKSGLWSMAASGANAMPFTLGNQLRKEGYTTMAFHNHDYDYYERDVSHPNMGYDYRAKEKGLDIEDTWPESDLEMMDESVSEYIKDQPFHVYYMTVSGHMNYSFAENAMSRKNKDLVEDLNLSDTAKAYLACQIELDRAIERLLKQLEGAGVLEHTLIAITPDHYPYGLNNEYISELAEKTIDEDFGVYKSTFLLYTPGMTPTVVDKPCSSLDVLPTLSNLMGLEYDSRLFVGTDIFSSSEPLVMLYSRNFITGSGRYNALTKEFTTAKNANVDEAYVKDMIKTVDAKFYYSAKILEENYYEKILSAIK